MLSGGARSSKDFLNDQFPARSLNLNRMSAPLPSQTEPRAVFDAQVWERLRRDSKRLDAVRRTGLLDSPPEPTFDRLTRLAAKLVDVPATFISLVDKDRDFYKSCFGFPEPLASTRQMEGGTFCHHALVAGEPLLIPDTTADPKFRDVPTVQSLGVRAYAGIPLMTGDGHAIGSFCAIDFKPRQWSTRDVEVLSELAQSAMREIMLREAVAEAEEQARLAREATLSRERVLAAVAHDLRTPLNLVKLGTQFVAEDLHASENPEMLGRMQNAIESMDRLIADLLDVSRIEGDNLTLKAKPWKAQTLLEDAISALRPLANRQEIQLIGEGAQNLPMVMADYERILRVFSNLIVNAVKFSKAGSEIRVTAERRNDTVCFSVIDHGVGIPAENLERLFDRFWQGDKNDLRGSGLGLAIAREIIQAHGGTLEVSSTVCKGSTFHFDLPIV